MPYEDDPTAIRVDIGKSTVLDGKNHSAEFVKQVTSVEKSKPETAKALKGMGEKTRTQLDDIFNRNGSSLDVLRLVEDDKYAAAQIHMLDDAIRANDAERAELLRRKIYKLTE